MLNILILIGHAGGDAVLNVTGSGTAVANFSMAVNEPYLDKNNEWQTETTWIDVEAWGKQAKRVSEKVTTGRLVYVEGRVKLNEWGEGEGKRAKIGLKLKTIKFLDKEHNNETIEVNDEEPYTSDKF